jgi:hypothetical protein
MILKEKVGIFPQFALGKMYSFYLRNFGRKNSGYFLISSQGDI